MSGASVKLQALLAPLAGLGASVLFGLGLVISGMANPAKVLGFLDIAGAWDPSLIFVMGGAVVVTFAGYRLLAGRSAPMLAQRFAWPTATAIDGRLMGGAALFGIGWGIGGYCPGPAITALSFAEPATLVFVVAMLAGMILGAWLRGRSVSTLEQPA